MKYFKFTQISAESGISWMIEQPLSGPSLPFTILPGLTNISQLAFDPAYYVGEADDSAQANPDNFIFEINAEERAELLKNHIDHIKYHRLQNIYDEENELRKGNFNKYDSTATVAGIYKYEEAKALVADNSAAAPSIRQEAILRNVTPLVLAQRIITNHEEFRTKEAKIAGIRGLIFDRLTNYTFDLQNPDTSMQEFFSTEKIGEITLKEIEDGVLIDKVKDVIVGKYELAIAYRYQYMG